MWPWLILIGKSPVLRHPWAAAEWQKWSCTQQIQVAFTMPTWCDDCNTSVCSRVGEALKIPLNKCYFNRKTWTTNLGIGVPYLQTEPHISFWSPNISAGTLRLRLPIIIKVWNKQLWCKWSKFQNLTLDSSIFHHFPLPCTGTLPALPFHPRYWWWWKQWPP